MSYPNLGNGFGYLYATIGSTLQLSIANNPAGVRALREFGLKSRMIGLGQRGVGVIEIATISGAGSVTQVIIDTNDQIGAAIPYTAGQEDALATSLAAEISSYTPASGLNWFAQAVGNFVYLYPPQGATSAVNGLTIAVGETGSITINTTDVNGASGQNSVYDESNGYRFYINADVLADPKTVVGADEITKWIVPRTLDMALPSETSDLNDGVLTIDRKSSISFAVCGTEGAVSSDDCIGITPVGFAENDLVYVRSVSASREVNFIQDPTGNLILREGADYTSSGTDGFILFQFVEGVFYEVFRNGGNLNYIITTMSLAQNSVSTASLIPGATYLISDRGDRGIVLRADTNNRFSLAGTYLAAVPDWQNVSGNFLGRWTSGLTPSVGSTVVWENLMYRNIFGINGASNPLIDSGNWDVLPLLTSTEYILEDQYCEFNFENDWVQRRIDRRGNDIAINYLAWTVFMQPNGFQKIPNLDFFVWGNDNVTGNKFIDSAWLSTNFNYGTFKNNHLKNFSLAVVSSLDVPPVIEGNSLDTARMQVDYTFAFSKFNDNTIENCRVIPEEYAGGAIEVINNKFRRAATKEQLFSSGYINIRVKTEFKNCVVNDYEVSPTLIPDSTQDWDGVVINNKQSGFTKSLTITGLTTIPPQSVSENMAGSFVLQSTNPSETIDSVDAAVIGTDVNVEYYTFRPASGLSVLFTGVAFGSVAAHGEIVIPEVFWDAGSPPGGELTIDGANGDYVKMRRATSGTFRCWIVEQVVQL